MPSGKIKSLLHFLDHVDQVESLEQVDTTSCLSGVDSVVWRFFDDEFDT